MHPWNLGTLELNRISLHIGNKCIPGVYCIASDRGWLLIFNPYNAPIIPRSEARKSVQVHLRSTAYTGKCTFSLYSWTTVRVSMHKQAARPGVSPNRYLRKPYETWYGIPYSVLMAVTNGNVKQGSQWGSNQWPVWPRAPIGKKKKSTHGVESHHAKSQTRQHVREWGFGPTSFLPETVTDTSYGLRATRYGLRSGNLGTERNPFAFSHNLHTSLKEIITQRKIKSHKAKH